MMGAAITDIYRYPVKGLSPERLDRVSLAPRECLPQDRRFAIALGSTVFDPHEPKWLPKTQFIMLMRDEKLAQLQTAFDPDSEILTVAQNGAVLLRERITREDGARRIAAFYADFLGDPTKGMLRVVEAPGHAFADARRKPNATTDKYVSLINRGSIRALEAPIGAPVDPLRFRANVYFDGAAPWSELDWLGRDIALGEVRLHGISAITRCAATEVNPTTAQRDLEIVAGLQRHFSHNLMGIYAEVVTGGDIALGDTVAAP